MKSWLNRSPEVAYLLNPAFCARILYGVASSYKKECQRDFPYVLSYLVLPIVLHKRTRQKILLATHMKVWIQRNPELLIGYSKRAKNLVSITNEGLEFLMQRGVIEFISDSIVIVQPLKASKMKIISDEEIKECFKKADIVGKWFARNGTVENIYQSWGVKP